MNLNWYDTLNKPPFTPPSGIFTPVWIILYILIFLSFIIFLNTNKSRVGGTILFIVQLALNLLWSPVFFYWHNMEFAFVIILLLVITVIGMMFTFYKNSKISSLLLIPYLLWLIFAAYLNWGFLIMN